MNIQDFTPTDWAKVRHFSRREKWGDPDRVNANLVYVLDLLREWLNLPIHINNAVEDSGHTDKSQHYVGNAADWRVICDIPFDELVKRIDAFLESHGLADKVGFGIYPNWRRPGFHLDVRGHRARWGAIPGANGGQRYVTQEAALDWHRTQGRT